MNGHLRVSPGIIRNPASALVSVIVIIGRDFVVLPVLHVTVEKAAEGEIDGTAAIYGRWNLRAQGGHAILDSRAIAKSVGLPRL